MHRGGVGRVDELIQGGVGNELMEWGVGRAHKLIQRRGSRGGSVRRAYKLMHQRFQLTWRNYYRPDVGRDRSDVTVVITQY